MVNILHCNIRYCFDVEDNKFFFSLFQLIIIKLHITTEPERLLYLFLGSFEFYGIYVLFVALFSKSLFHFCMLNSILFFLTLYPCVNFFSKSRFMISISILPKR